ncbi:M10 family metallopeptidase [Roseibium sp. RKSG952]|uniref:M10 family metallopeptidase n=1 Tax=Roseibium sp. RKSG952 TaxID=2529384 RepID=UPI0012BC280C|nr:M10 family metallopeptidase [Roseibium sp. RKSG952]MTH96818.1 matrixin family metalloprotease [Roseibium sp. RKSG952]
MATAYSYDQIAYQLTDDYWDATGEPTRSFDVQVGGTITVNYSALTSKGQLYAYYALEMWSDATGLNFVSTNGAADITFDDNDSGAYAYSNLDRFGNIESSHVNVSTSWIARDGNNLSNYSFQTYVHEIGHALGLGHASNYNGSADYGQDNLYLNDSWQGTVMSYFSQNENTYIDADFAYVATPQIADVIAIQNLYGSAGTTRTGDTTYGDNSNAGTAWEHLTTYSRSTTYTIVDDGGEDTIDFSSSYYDQILDLREESISSVRGVDGNLMIARGTEIENAIGGRGDDYLVANDQDNVLTGGSGADVFYFFTNESPSANTDTITDFQTGTDIIVLDDGQSGVSINFDLLDIISLGSDTSINFGDDEIILENVSASTVDANDFMFA